jgi:hypothetical protein
MSPDETMTQHNHRHHEAVQKLIAAVRTAALVLKDAGQKSLAGELEAQLFLIDELDRELTETILKDPKLYLDALLRSRRPG